MSCYGDPPIGLSRVLHAVAEQEEEMPEIMTTADAMAAPNLTRAGLSSNVVGVFALTALVLEL
jgi:hypothetical protein